MGRRVLNRIESYAKSKIFIKRRSEICICPHKSAADCVNNISVKRACLTAEILDVLEEGNRLVRFTWDAVPRRTFEEVLDTLGEMPLPPYITHKLADRSRYNTVYAKHDGSAAAPTAGLHFTEELLGQIREKGVRVAYVTLHVGLGTFRPVKVRDVREHHMHSEWYNVPEDTARLMVYPIKDLSIVGYYRRAMGAHPAIAPEYNVYDWYVFDRYGGGVYYKSKYGWFRGEYMEGHTHGYLARGAYATLGYNILTQLDASARYDYFVTDTSRPSETTQHLITAGVRWRPMRFFFAQLNYSCNMAPGGGKPPHLVNLQTTLLF